MNGMRYSKLDVLFFMEYAYGFINLGYVHDIFRFHSRIKINKNLVGHSNPIWLFYTKHK
jgi:hypothetical protein